MPQLRRSTDRRRRVLYQTQAAPSASIISNRSVEELRAARQPAAEFGSRVHRRLRGRWFSLVPVSGLAMGSVASVLLTIPLLLTVCHYLAVSQAQLAFQETLARPLRIDRPDSFASWWLSVSLLLSAGVSWLIFQLRLHRNDDYRGHYRLWQLTLIVMVIASVHTTVDLIGWVGAALDLLVGDRAVLSGANWLRILLNIGGMILAMRLVAEVHRCRAAMMLMIAATMLLGTAEAGKWNVYEIDSVARVTFVIAAPLLAFSCFLVGAIVYLRLLYRQVRKLADPVGLRNRFKQWMFELRTQSEPIEADFLRDWEPNPPSTAKQTAVMPKSSTAAGKVENTPKDNTAKDSATEPIANENSKASSGDSKASSGGPGGKPRRRWLSFAVPRRAAQAKSESGPDFQSDSESASESDSNDSKRDAASADDKPGRNWFGRKHTSKQRTGRQRTSRQRTSRQRGQDETKADQTSRKHEAPQSDSPGAAESKKKRKRGFSLRLRPRVAAADKPSEDDSDQPSHGGQQSKQNPAATDPADESDSPAKQKRPGLLGRLRARRQSESNEASEKEQTKTESTHVQSGSNSKQGTRGGQPKPASTQAATSAPDDEPINEDDIDWNSLSKSERRRLRKKLRRGNRAA